MDKTIKRCIDFVGALGSLLLLMPFLLVIALLIKCTSSGPILFRQGRLGKGGRRFEICKFRSMYDKAGEIRNEDGSAYCSSDDPRVTPIGRWLRRTSLDELPQLWNVLVGDMSLVGPRPDQFDQLRYYNSGDMRKLEIRPGITGLAQISGRNRISWEQRRQFDVDYASNWSLALDLSIVCRTLPYVLLRRDIHEENPNASDRIATRNL